MVKLVGILNLTPDSFSDGGQFNNLDDALRQVDNLIEEGSDVIDVGAESTRPNATPIDHPTEWERLKDILPQIATKVKEKKLILSLDTRHAETAEKGINLGANIINDVSAAADKRMLDLLKNSDIKFVVTHNLGIPADPKKTVPPEQDIFTELVSWGDEKLHELRAAGIRRDQIIFDPGIGFGKTEEQSMEILSNLYKLKILNLPLFIGHSRKSYLDLFHPKSLLEKDIITASIAKNIEAECEYIRVHNIALTKNILTGHGKFGEIFKPNI